MATLLVGLSEKGKTSADSPTRLEETLVRREKESEAHCRNATGTQRARLGDGAEGEESLVEG